MASTISYAKIVRNHKDGENISPDGKKSSEDPASVNQESESKTPLTEKEDQSFKEVSNVKKVCYIHFKVFQRVMAPKIMTS